MKILKFKLMEATPGTGGSTSTPSTPTPSSAPSTPAPASSSTESSSGDFDFAALALDTGDGGEQATPPTPAVSIQPSAPSSGAAAPTTPVATPATPASPSPAPAAPATPAPAAAAPTPAAPPAAPQGQSQGQPPVAAPQPQNPTDQPGANLTPEAIAQAFENHRKQFLPQLQQMYTIPEAEVEELRTAPETALPKLAAKLHYEIQLSTFQSLVQQLPQLLSPILEQRAQVDKLTSEFRTMWPALHEKPEYEAAAEQAIRSVRAVNPKLPMKEVLKQAGVLALISLGLPVTAPGGSTQSTAPAAPIPPTPAAPPAPPIARPPGIGASSSPLLPPGGGDEGNIWAQMAEEHLRGG